MSGALYMPVKSPTTDRFSAIRGVVRQKAIQNIW